MEPPAVSNQIPIEEKSTPSAGLDFTVLFFARASRLGQAVGGRSILPVAPTSSARARPIPRASTEASPS